MIRHTEIAPITGMEPVVSNVQPTQDQIVSYYDLDDVNSYDFSTAPGVMTSLVGTRHGSFTPPINIDTTAYVNGDNVYGTDSPTGKKYIWFHGGGSSNNIRVNQTVSLTNWSQHFRLKHRVAVGASYDRMFGTRNYRMELVVNNSSQVWYYQSGWVNTGVVIPNDGFFHDLVWTYQHSPKVFSIYLDGVLVYQTSSRGTTLVSSSYYWVLGSQDSRNYIQPMNKHILYGKTLTQTEINHNLNI